MMPILNSAPAKGTRFIVDGKSRQFTGRKAQMLATLIKGPVPAPSIYRHAAYVQQLRVLGVRIHTEFKKSSKGVRFGVYHLRSNVKLVQVE